MQLSIFRVGFFPIFLFYLGCSQKANVASPVSEIDLSACISSVSDENLEIITWNIKDFPFRGDTTVSLISHIVEMQQPDIIAFQEIVSMEDFDAMTASLDGYDGQMMHTGHLDMGFLYKEEEITIEEDIREILTGDFYAFPRPPLMIKIKHVSGFNTTLISVHLKCCDGQDNFSRRKAASRKLKEYIDFNLPNAEVVVLGDFNDVIAGKDPSEIPFTNFIDDADNFKFADLGMALSNENNWSYPGWPSHIDHILISNELFMAEQETVTLAFDECYKSYFNYISDHRPLMIKLSN